MQLIVSRAMRGEHGPDVREELEHEGRAALCGAAVTWDEDKGRFSTFAGRRIVRSVVGYLRTMDGGTQWRARKQQEARRLRRMVAESLEDDPYSWEQAYVSTSWGRKLNYSVPWAGETQLAYVPIEDAPEAVLGVPPEVEDGAEGRFLERWKTLSRAQRTLVDKAQDLGEGGGGVSLSQLAVAVGERRDRVEVRLGEAVAALVSES